MKKCSTCQYRAAKTDDNGCDYYLIMNRRRGCPVDNCDRYEPGEKIILKGTIRGASFRPGELRDERNRRYSYGR